ncbi:MAG: VCBS repeat-containing protein [Thermoplasmata archaeon]|nr:MAG: VCBS repeat-containing protein [Thermoplasmata archaeon]
MKHMKLLSLCVTFVVSLAIVASCALLTVSDVPPSAIALKDVNNDGLVDVVDSHNKIFWNQGDNQYCSNEMILTDHELTKEGFSSYYAHQDPVNATSLNYKPSFFIFNHIHIENENGNIINLYNMSTTFYGKNKEGTYIPKSTINPSNDFILFLHMHPDPEYHRLDE